MLRAQLQITDQDARTIQTTPGNEYSGQTAYTKDGRVYVYSTAGASNLLAANLTIPAATTANHVNQTGTANAVGSTSITYTLGATDAAQDLYAGGYFAVNDTATQANVYRIKSNTLSNAANSRAITVVLDTDEPLTVATTTSSKFSLYPPPYKNLIQSPGDSAAYQVAGVPNVAVTATYAYWSQVGGYAAVLSDGIIGKGSGAIVSTGTAGAAVVEGTSTVTQRIGFAPEATVSAKWYPLVLTIRTA